MLETVLNPGILFFILGTFAALIKSDLNVSEPIIKFITLYLMIAIGFSGGINLSTSSLDFYAISVLLSVLLISFIVPVYTFYLMRRWMDDNSAAALGGNYGSNSTLTYITAAAFLTASNVPYSGYMTVALVLMELPAIIVSLTLLTKNLDGVKLVLKNAMRDGTLVLLLGSMFIAFILVGLQEDDQILSKFLTGDIFTGFLLFFLLYMGIRVGTELRSNYKELMHPEIYVYAIAAPIAHAIFAFGLASIIGLSAADGFLLMILSCSSSYIVAPALYKELLPQAFVSKYLTPSIAITFPMNIIFGIPIYWQLAQHI